MGQHLLTRHCAKYHKDYKGGINTPLVLKALHSRMNLQGNNWPKCHEKHRAEETRPLRLHVPCPCVNYKRCSFLKAVTTTTWMSAPICLPFKEGQDYTQLYVQGRGDICRLDFSRQRRKKGGLPEGENRKQKEMTMLLLLLFLLSNDPLSRGIQRHE